MASLFNIEVAYTNAEQQKVISLLVAPGCTAAQAIKQSGILSLFKDIDLNKNPVGIFSKKVSLDALVQVGDRVEIYRPLLIDPKQARKRRARDNGAAR